MLSEFDVDVLELLLVPAQLPTFHPELGLAVNEIACPAVYSPLGHPGEFEGLATGLPPDPVCVSDNE